MKGKILKGPTSEDRIRVIHTGLDVNRLKIDDNTRDQARIETRRTLGIPEDACVVGTLSRVSVEKGHANLLKATARLVHTHPHLHVLILGTGPARPHLEDLTSQLGLEAHVTFTGFYDDLPGALSSMDLLAQPSILEEGFPTSVLEAQLASLPVVASDIGGTAETMDVPNTGVIVPPGNVPALTEALSSLLADPGRLRTMGGAARQFVEQTFTLENMITQVCSTYNEAMEAS
jgi:glycosyltransferase involved in cell wall biosynthesis